MLYEKVMSEIKDAMKNKQVDKRDALKQVLAKAQETAKEKKVDITDEIMESAFNRELKQLSQTVVSLKGHEDSSLYQSSIYKVELLKSFLPEKMSEEEVKDVLTQAFSTESNLNMGVAMKKAKEVIGNKADSAVIAKVVKQMLGLK
jgi:hypothetical protein